MISFINIDRTAENIDNLINLNLDYLQLFSTRLKANNLFKEFDYQARGDFMNLIKLSQERYKSVKSGNAVDTILDNQKERYRILSENVESEDFYNNIPAIREEKRKFLKIRNKLRNKELTMTRSKIREKREDGIKTKLEEANLKSNTTFMNSRSNLSQGRKRSLKMISKQKFFSTNGETREHDLNPIISSLDQQGTPDANKECKIFTFYKLDADFIEEDMKKFESQMEDYYIYLNNIQQSVTNGENSNIAKNFTFLTEDINLLSYRPQIYSNVVKVSDNGNKLDIYRLMKLSKRYKHKIGNYREESSKKETDLEIQDKSEFAKGIYLIKNEISNLKKLGDIMNKKRNMFNKFFEENTVKKIENYENISKKNFSSVKNVSNVVQEKLLRTEENLLNKNRLESIKQDMIKTLEETKSEWEKDHFQKEKFEKLEKERRMMNINFLNEIEKKPKILQKYVDPYSTREEFVKKNIKILTKSSKNKSNSKEISANIENLENINIKESLETRKNIEIIENLKRNIAIDENPEEEDGSVILGANRKEMNSDIFKSNYSNQIAKAEKVYEEFQEYKKLIIEKEKNILKENAIKKEERNKKFLNHLQHENTIAIRSGMRNISPVKFLNKTQDVVDKRMTRGLTIDHGKGYQIRSHDLGKF